MARMRRRKSFSPDAALLTCRIWIPHWSGRLATPLRGSLQLKSVHWQGRYFWPGLRNLHNERIYDTCCD